MTRFDRCPDSCWVKIRIDKSVLKRAGFGFVRRRCEMVRRSIWVGIVVLCLAFAVQTPMSLGQAVFGSIFGTVTDQQGAGVVGAKVTITSTGKGTTFEVTTNESGNYTV